MKLWGHLYEVTELTSFIRHYVVNRSQPSPDSIRPIRDAHVILCQLNKGASTSRVLVESKTDEGGRFELNVPNLSDTSVFLYVSGPDDVTGSNVGNEHRSNYRYRSFPFDPDAIGELRRDMYVARLALPNESGYSQASLADALTETKKQSTDIDWIRGTITSNGIVLSCGGKGARASGRLVLKPNLSGDLTRILDHSVEDFHLELPGPSWLVGFVVSRDAIAASIRAGLADLANEISERLRLNTIALFTGQVPPADPEAAKRLVGETTLSVNRLLYTTTPGSESSMASSTITIEACVGFDRTLKKGTSRV